MATRVSLTAPYALKVPGKLAHQFRIELVEPVPRAIEHSHVLTECAQQRRQRMSASLQLPLVIEVRFEFLQPDEIPLRQMREARKIKGAQRQAQIAGSQKLTRQFGPTIFGQLIGSN